MARKKNENKTEYISIPVQKWEKEEFREDAKNRNMTMAGMGRMMFGQFREEGCNESIVMQQLIELTQKINDLQEIIPQKKYASIQKNIGNIMKIKGGR